MIEIFFWSACATVVIMWLAKLGKSDEGDKPKNARAKPMSPSPEPEPTPAVARAITRAAKSLRLATFETKVAGAQHHTTGGDIGVFKCIVLPDKNNPYDKNALGIYRTDGKLMGYIPRDEQRAYLRWGDGETKFGLGYITESYISGEDKDVRWGRVAFFDTDDEGNAEQEDVLDFYESARNDLCDDSSIPADIIALLDAREEASGNE